MSNSISSSGKKKQNHKIPWTVNNKGKLRWLESLALIVEQLFNRLGNSLKLNIFYHTDTIAVFLWLIVAITGIYITFFYQFGFDSSYEAVTKIESQFVARTIRAIHRYASGSAVIITLLHAYRTFFMDRFRGARWLAWVSGIGMGVFLWLDGITGYWLVWDQRAQVINDTFVTFLNRYFGSSGSAFALSLLTAEQADQSWLVMFLLLTAHIALFVIVVAFFWYHVVRLNNPKLFPPGYWMIGAGLAIVIASAFFPVGMLPQATFNLLPDQIELDSFFLFFLPAELDGNSANLFWISILIVVAVLLAIPWIAHRPKPVSVKVIAEACIGCTLCVVDCPYKALEMVERKNGKGSRLVAIEHLNLCVSCGICIGSCDYDAIEVGDLNAKAMWEATSLLLAQAKEKAPDEQVKVVFTCERHAAHGARSYLDAVASSQKSDPRIITIPLPCVGAAPPSLVGETYTAGASEVQIIGCPPEDCAQRRGNTWTEARLTRERKPLLKVPYKNAPISFDWQPPNLFKKAVEKITTKEEAELTWRNYLPVFGLLIALLVAQILFTNLPFNAYPEPQAKVQLIAPDLSEALSARLAIPYNGNTKLVTRLILNINSEVFVEQIYSPETLFSNKITPVFEEISLPPGDYHIEVRAAATEDEQTGWTLLVGDVTLEDREIYQITLTAPDFTHQD